MPKSVRAAVATAVAKFARSVLTKQTNRGGPQ